MPWVGIKPRPRGPKSKTLAIMSLLLPAHTARLYKCWFTTLYHIFLLGLNFRFVLESQPTFILDLDVLWAHQMGYLHWGQMWSNVTYEKMLVSYALAGDRTQAAGFETAWVQNQTLYHVTLKADSYYLSFHSAAPSHEYYVQLRCQCKDKS